MWLFVNPSFLVVKKTHALGTIPDMDVWLKADAGTMSTIDGSATGNWQDQSGRGNNYTNVVWPTLQTNELNFNPAVEILSWWFDAPVGAALGNQYSLFFISKKLPSDDNGRLFDAHAGNKLWGYHDVHRNSIYIEANPNNYNSGIAVNDGSHLEPHLFYYDRNTSAQALARADGKLLTTFNSTNSPTWARIDISAWVYGGGSQRSDSHVYEFMLYDRKLSSWEIGQVESYLALKYGMTLDSSSNTYKNSIGGNVFTYDGTHQYHVTGIGKDTGSSLDQQISKSIESGSILTLSTDTNFTSANGTHTSLSNNQYFIAASNNAATSSQTTELDTGLYVDRISREWKVGNIGSVGTVHLKFSWFFAEYSLLVDSDWDFSSGAVTVGSLNDNGEISASISHWQYFTIARKDDFIDPTISSVFPANNQILPIWNFDIQYEYNDNVGGSGIQVETAWNIAPTASITASIATTWGVPPHPNSIVNGIKRTDGAYDYEYHSNSGNAFIEFEWPTPQKISTMQIYNRVWCCSNRLTNATIKLYDETDTLLYTHTLWNTDWMAIINIDFSSLWQVHDVAKLRLDSVGNNTINIREIEIFPEETIELYKWDGVSTYGDDISSTYIDFSNKVLTNTGSTYPVSWLSFGKYKIDFIIKDNQWNSTSSSTIFYVDQPEFSVSTGTIDVGNLDPMNDVFSPSVTLTVKTVGAWFDLIMNRSSNFTEGIENIPNWNGTTGYGYQKTPYNGLVDAIDTDELIVSQAQIANTNGDKNTYTYDLQIWALIDIQQPWWNYEGGMDFSIILDY